ncbi:MAG: rRNA pseudouridine synthase [Oscillatoriales cyanobacterium]|nr:MAG: rRNA pseudouridine synthase [Oscillatoriales cyanobacterium]
MTDRPDPEQPQRLQKILSQWGIASRRHAEALITAGRVRVNGQVAEIGAVVRSQRDRIEVDGQWVRPADRPAPLYLLLNKPAKVLSACADDRSRATVLDLLPRSLTEQTGLHPIGRLDWDSTGALLLTNQGELTNALTHPRFHLPKTYRVWVQGQPGAADLDRWRAGVLLDGRPTLPAQVRVVQTQRDRRGDRGDRGDRTELEIVLVEGRNRQIRRMAELFNHPVIKLHRVAIGSLTLRSPDGSLLASGRYRDLTPAEIRMLYQQTRLDRPQ